MTLWNHYALADPRISDEVLSVRYIGRTTKTESARYKAHLQDAKTKGKSYKAKWIRSLLADGIEPTLVILGSGTDQCESEWIALYRACGAPLTNATDGGEGIANPNLELRNKLSQARKRYLESSDCVYKTQAFKEKMSLVSTSVQSSTEYRTKMSDILKKAKSSPETRAKMSLAAKAGLSSPETRRKLSEASKAAWASPELRSKRAIIKGEQQHCSKLTRGQVRLIREIYPIGIVSQRQFAAEMRVHQRAISNVVNRRTWKWVDNEEKEIYTP